MLDGRLERARALWDEGVSAGQIAARIGHGCTKSALVGKAHRQGWPPRPSPIGQYVAEVREAAERVPDKPHHRPAPYPSEAPHAVSARAARRAAKRAATKPSAALRVACKPDVLGVPTAAFRGCQWPTTDARPWQFCDAPTVNGGPWCPEHHKCAHERTPHRGDAMWGVSL
jgi:hypothetical protein